jgi:hypothetical protein
MVPRWDQFDPSDVVAYEVWPPGQEPPDGEVLFIRAEGDAEGLPPPAFERLLAATKRKHGIA